MSEQGWQGFLRAHGVDGWVVLHGGATAVFRVPSVRDAARLAEALAEVPGPEGSGVDRRAPSGIPAGAADAVRDTLGGALAIAQTLPGELA